MSYNDKEYQHAVKVASEINNELMSVRKQLQAEQDHHHLTLSALMDVMMAVKAGKSKEVIVEIFDQYVREVGRL